MKRSLGLFLAFCLFPAIAHLTWLSLARLDFLYPVWYQMLGIEQHIASYAPQNRYGKADFTRTSPGEHRRLFGQLVLAIHGKEKLAAIVYRDAAGRSLGQFLQADEIGHLEDVAGLVKALTGIGWFFVLATLGGALAMWRQRLTMPPSGRTALAAALFLGLGSLSIVLVGPRQIFNLLHAWIFPPDHPWFFYYQDSLMTTAIKAPQIFAVIAAVWALLSLIGYGLIYAGLGALLSKRLRSALSEETS